MTAVTDLIAQLRQNRTVQNPAGEALVANTDTFIAAILELAGGGGGGSPGGNPSDVQFNDAGAFGGNDTFIWDDAAKALKIVTTEGTLNFSTDDGTSASDISYRGTFAFGGSLNISVGDALTNNQSIAMNTGQFIPMFVEDASPSGDGITLQSLNGQVTINAGTNVVLKNVVVQSTATLISSQAALANGAAAQVGTLTNAPAAGNPTKWIAIDDGGTVRHFPAW